MDEDDNVIEEMPDLPFCLQTGAVLEYSKLILGKPQAAGFKLTVVDPNK
jgi:hypothetical protein